MGKWALVLWMNKTFDILPASDIIREGSRVIVLAKWTDGEYYKAKVLAESNDIEQLQCLHVETTGVIDFAQSELPTVSSVVETDIQSQSIAMSDQASQNKNIVSSARRNSMDNPPKSLRDVSNAEKSLLCETPLTVFPSDSTDPGNCELIHNNEASIISRTNIYKKGKKFPSHKSKFLLPRIHYAPNDDSNGDDSDIEILTVIERKKSATPHRYEPSTYKTPESRRCSEDFHLEGLGRSSIISPCTRSTPLMPELHGTEDTSQVQSPEIKEISHFKREAPVESSLAEMTREMIRNPFCSSSSRSASTMAFKSRKNLNRIDVNDDKLSTATSETSESHPCQSASSLNHPSRSDVSGDQRSTASATSKKTSISSQSHPRQPSSSLDSSNGTEQNNAKEPSPITIRLLTIHMSNTECNEESDEISRSRILSSLGSDIESVRKLRSVLMVNSQRDLGEDSHRAHPSNESISSMVFSPPPSNTQQSSPTRISISRSQKIAEKNKKKPPQVNSSPSRSCSQDSNRRIHNASSLSACERASTSKTISTSSAMKNRKNPKCSHAKDSDVTAEIYSSDSDEDSIVDWTASGRNRVELIAGTGVYIDGPELEDMRKRWLKKPRELVRRLLKNIVGNQKLEQMTRTGAGNREHIPKRILRTVKKFMRQEVPRKLVLSTFEYERCIDKYCDNLRQSRKRR